MHLETVMPSGFPLAPLTLDDAQREQLQGIARSTSLPHGLVLRARMILASADGLTNQAVALRVGAAQSILDKVARLATRICGTGH